jgi:hypothetical protein
MVPVIDTSESLSDVLYYNENKVKKGVAELIHASGFLQDKEDLNVYDKFNRFQKLNELNERVKKNTLHVSLNFHPEDQLSQAQLSQIADIYMARIGYANQPYLVYQHYDSGHPHVHIVSSLIQSSGIRIPTNNVGKNESVKARKEIDQKFGLRRIEESQVIKEYEPEPISAEKVIYGKLETKKGIKDVLRFVLKKYKFTSLPELNAVLQQWNVLADRGTPGSRTYENGGLVYRVLDAQMQKIGVPIKASDFHFKPTLKTLEEKFEQNRPLRKQEIPDIKGRIDWALGKHSKSFQGWQEELRKENIRLVVRRNDQGVIYGLTYIDFKSRSVLNGTDLGKEYSANAITRRFSGAAATTSTASPTPIMSSVDIHRGDEKPRLPGKKQPVSSTNKPIATTSPRQKASPLHSVEPSTNRKKTTADTKKGPSESKIPSNILIDTGNKKPQHEPVQEQKKMPSTAQKGMPAAKNRFPHPPAGSDSSKRLPPNLPSRAGKQSIPISSNTVGQGKSLLNDLLKDLPADQIPYELTAEAIKKKKKKRLRQ